MVTPHGVLSQLVVHRVDLRARVEILQCRVQGRGQFLKAAHGCVSKILVLLNHVLFSDLGLEFLAKPGAGVRDVEHRRRGRERLPGGQVAGDLGFRGPFFRVQAGHQVNFLVQSPGSWMGPEVPDLEAACAHRLVSLGRPRLAGRQDPQRLPQRVHVGRMRLGSRRAEDHLVGRVVRRADLAAIMRECLRVRQGDQAEIADQPGAIQFVEIAGLDVPVGNVEVRLQARQGIRDRRHGFDDISERPTREGLGNRCGDGHSQPWPVCLARLVRQMRIEQREQSRRALVLPQEADLADESLVRLMLDLGDVEDLKGDCGLSVGASRLPDGSIASVA